MNNKYAYEIYSLVTNKTFSITAGFQANTEDHPLQVLRGRINRYVFTIVSAGKGITANVPVDAVPGIRARTDYAFRRHMDRAVGTSAASADTASSPAFSLKFATGSLKGKTPGEVMLTVPNAKDVLRKEYIWLQKNADKYPANRKLMAAIVEAARMPEEELKKHSAETDTGTVISILNIGCRPLVRKKREDGMCPCYEMQVDWNTSRNYPVTVQIRRYYAPVTKKDGGTLNVQMSQKDKSSEQSEIYSMTAEAWLDAVHEMEQARDYFILFHYRRALDLAEKEDKEARENYRRSHKESVPAPDVPEAAPESEGWKAAAEDIPEDFLGMPAPESASASGSTAASEEGWVNMADALADELNETPADASKSDDIPDVPFPDAVPDEAPDDTEHDFELFG